MSDTPKQKILWLTNLPAPYRFPIWDRIAEDVDLTVAFLLKRNNWRKWPVPENKKWKFKYLSFHSFQLKEYDIIPSFRGARRLLKKVDVVVIGGWESPMFIRTILLAKKKKIPVIQFYESFQGSHRFKTGPISHLRKWIFSKPDKIITISKESALTLAKLGVAENRISTLFNPIDVNWFHTFAMNHRVQQVRGHRFIYVGQLIDRKNVETIIRAFAVIRGESDTLTIAGDGPLARYLQELTGTLAILDSVFFTGHQNQEQLAELYAASHTLILASTNEVWGLVVNEALASGLHVVVSNKCGVADFTKDMKGAYISSTDQESIQDALLKSSQAWFGYIENPEILKFTPEKFAAEVLSLLN